MLRAPPPPLNIMDPASDAAWWLYECRRNERTHAGRGAYREADAWAAAAKGAINVPPAYQSFVKDGPASRRRQRNPLFTNVGSHTPSSGVHRYAEITRIAAGDGEDSVCANAGYYAMVGNVAADVTDDVLGLRREQGLAPTAAAD